MEKKKGGMNKYIGFAFSFGITLAITIFVLYLGGQWLDNKLGTKPLFMMIGVVLAVTATLKNLIDELKTMDKKEKEEKTN